MQILDQCLEAMSINPTTHLLINNMPWWQVVGQHAPVTAGLGYITQRVEDGAQRVLALLRILATQRQIRRYKCPLFIRHIRRIARAIPIAHSGIVTDAR